MGVDQVMLDERLQKHIARWLTLGEAEKERFRKEWSWLADAYDKLVHKYVGQDVKKRAAFEELARIEQLRDHSRACEGHLIPEIPSLSRPAVPSKKTPRQTYFIRKSLAG
jgi:hypothetical protein